MCCVVLGWVKEQRAHTPEKCAHDCASLCWPPCLLCRCHHHNLQLDIVVSGLEDTMMVACQETMKTADELQINYRVAAFVNAIKKIHSCYIDAGITV